MKIREGRLVNARFTDNTCTMIRAEFKNYDKPEGENLSIQMHSYNPENKFVEKPVTLQDIVNLANRPEEFFKLKLEIFELAEVKTSKDRKWKASMRKSTTTLELLALLSKVDVLLESESSEPQD